MIKIGKIIGKFIRNSSQREIDRLKPIVEKINSWESKIKDMPSESFPAKTAELKSKVRKGIKSSIFAPFFIFDFNSIVLDGKLSSVFCLISASRALIFSTIDFNALSSF